MLATRRAGVLILLSVLCSLATSAFCGQQPPAGSAVPPSDAAEVRQRVADQQRELDRLAGRFEGLEQTTNAAAKASEAACQHADLVIKSGGALAGIVTLVVLLLGFFGYRRVQDFARGEIDKARRHFDELIAQVEQHVGQAKKSAEELAEDAKLAKEYIARIDAFRRQAEEQVRALATVDLSKDMPPELKQSLEDIRTKLDLVEALGLPLDAEAYLARGNAYYSRGDHQRSLQCYDRALQIKPDYAEAHCNRGVALGKLRRHDEALAAHDRALQIKPDYAEAHGNRGAALGRLGRDEEALAASDRALQIKPDLAEAHCNRGVALSKLGRHEEALAASDRALQIKPDYANAHVNRAVALISIGRYEEAFAACNRALQIKPDEAVAYFNRACAHSRLNRKAEALADLREAIRLDPEWKEKAKTDPDFEGLRADPEFRRLVGLDDEPSV